MAYDFYLDKTLLPIAPSKLQVKINNNNKTLSLINDGEINILKMPGLTDISFTVMIPQMEYPFAVYIDKFQKADVFLDKFEELKRNQMPFQFIVARALQGGRTGVDFGNTEKPFIINDKSLFSTNIKVSLEKYKITEDAKSGFDVSVDIELKQYKTYGTKTVDIKSPSSEQQKVMATVETQRPAENPPTTKTYAVTKGDCLWNIAQKMLGDGSRYPEIYEMNKAAIDAGNKGTGNTKYTIYPGQVFTIPS